MSDEVYCSEDVRREEGSEMMYMICKHGDQITVKQSDKDYDFGTVIDQWGNYKSALLCARVERMVIKQRAWRKGAR